MTGKRLILFFIVIVIIFTGCRKTDPVIPEVVYPPVTAPATNTPPVVAPPAIVPPVITSLSISNVLQSDMVIQRDKPFVIWGNAPAAHNVNVAVSWNNGTFIATADINGVWEISIPAEPATNIPQSISCSSEGLTPITLTNILIGDVWVCAGQSNMVMPLDAIEPFSGVIDYQTEITAANYPDIRALTITDDYQQSPLKNLNNPSAWVVCSPQTAGKLSAVAYYFAKKTQNIINVPIGIIITASNGSNCAAWMNNDAGAAYPDIAQYLGEGGNYLFNGVISPLTNLQIKGFLWYQGENDQYLSPVSDYTKLNSAMIKYWRSAFKQPELPFYLVQLTPFADDYNATTPAGGNLTLNWLGYFREAQGNVLAVPNTGMAITMDVGEAANHHPRNKKPVGERLALLALKNTYGQNVVCDGPKYSSYSANGNTAVISFTGVSSKGLNSNYQPLNQLFFIAGTDHVFRQGTAQILGSTISVTAPAATPLPIQAIRYAFTNSAITNIQNEAGLPIEPFRTDNWSN